MRVRSPRLGQLVAHGDRVGRLTAAVKVEHRVVDQLVRRAVEVGALELLDAVGDGVLAQQHAAEHRLLGPDVLRRQPVVGGPALAGRRRERARAQLIERHTTPLSTVDQLNRIHPCSNICSNYTTRHRHQPHRRCTADAPQTHVQTHYRGTKSAPRPPGSEHHGTKESPDPTSRGGRPTQPRDAAPASQQGRRFAPDGLCTTRGHR